MLRLQGAAEQALSLNPGNQSLELRLPAVEQDRTLTLQVDVGGKTVLSRSVVQKPVPKLDVFLLPHSHVDIGYTALQPEVEKKAS